MDNHVKVYNAGGYIDYSRMEPDNSEVEPLLPTGFQEEDETNKTEIKSNQASEEVEPLLPPDVK